MEQHVKNTHCHIEGVTATPLRIIADERGAVLHMLRSDSPVFHRFGEVYFSEVRGGAVKAWKRHLRMTQNFAVPVGRIKVVIYDNRPSSPTLGTVGEYILGRPDQYLLLSIPPMLWYGFQAISESTALLTNCSDMPHDPDESERLELNNSEIPYEW